jgi:hypothetical protein
MRIDRKSRTIIDLFQYWNKYPGVATVGREAMMALMLPE